MSTSSRRTYTLPFGDKIRIASHFRFVLVRQANNHEALPFTVRRSGTRATVERHYVPATDYLIDQETGIVSFHFNGHRELADRRGQRVSA